MITAKGIWIFVEINNGSIHPGVFELLTRAVQLKEELNNQDDITAVVLGSSLNDCVFDALFSYGAEKVIAVEEPALANYSCRVYQRALSFLSKKYSPSIFLFVASEIGRELAPLVMWDLQTGLTADAIDLSVDADGMFVQTTPAYGGKIYAHIAIPVCRPQMVTVHPGVFERKPRLNAKKGEVIYESVKSSFDDAMIKLSETVREKNASDISAADVLIAGGRGIKKKEDLQLLQELARILHGSVACSRPLVDCGWLPHENQIGQSGKNVKPKLIINVGISGSTQYISGMKNADCVISINTDPDASIFDVSDIAVTGDYREILPAVIKQLTTRNAPGLMEETL